MTTVPGWMIFVFSLVILVRGIAILQRSRGRLDSFAGVVVLLVAVGVMILGILFAKDQETQRQLERHHTNTVVTKSV